jgi:hypothetical protein
LQYLDKRVNIPNTNEGIEMTLETWTVGGLYLSMDLTGKQAAIYRPIQSQPENNYFFVCQPEEEPPRVSQPNDSDTVQP